MIKINSFSWIEKLHLRDKLIVKCYNMKRKEIAGRKKYIFMKKACVSQHNYEKLGNHIEKKMKKIQERVKWIMLRKFERIETNLSE